MEKQYTQEINLPKDKKEGLMNFVQMIINEIEAGNERNALLIAVDLKEDLRSGQYGTDELQKEKISMKNI